MQEMMRGMMYLGPGQIELRQVPVPQPGAGEVLIRVRAATTCGTDVKTFLRGHPKIPPPTLFGHELAGEVMQVGEGVERFAVGMRVAAYNTAPCGACFYCKHGQANLCEHLLYNFGSYAEYNCIPAPIVRQNLFQIPDSISFPEAAILEPLSTVVHGQDLVRVRLGETVAIFGAGPIGLMHLQIAQLRGASRVIIVDRQSQRLAVARELGASALVDASQQDPLPVIKGLTEGRGADVCIECVGAKETWLGAVQAVRPGGRVLWFGGLPAGTQVELDGALIHYGEITLFGIYHATPGAVQTAFELIANRVVNVRALITTELPLERLEEALQMMRDGRAVKVAMIP